ncbi:MAG: hypothetical protein AB8H86_18930 [Polyangiales bacterium]
MNRLGALLFVLVLPLSASLVGCICNDELVITEEFENFCEDGAPCAWTATGPVSRASTYHPDVYGVAIPAGSTLTGAETFGFRRLGILVQCDEGATVEFNGRAANAPADSFGWLYSSQAGAVSISVSGSGQCIVDDVGFIDECEVL